MDDRQELAGRFEEQRGHLRAVAYRMLGSTAEADDVVQDAWLRVSRADASGVDNLAGWFTTIVARLAIDRLRARSARREESLEGHIPDPVVTSPTSLDPESEMELADSLGLAMLVVLETLGPAERVAFVLHDVFGVPFEEIGPIVERSPVATRQLASRARRRVRGATPARGWPRRVPRSRQWELVDAFLAAARQGDLDALMRILDPEIVASGALRSGQGPAAAREVRGAANVAHAALGFSRFAPGARRALVNGTAGLVVFDGDRPYAILGFSFAGDSIVGLTVLADPDRLARIDLSAL
jgi:RNA polymerase sigma factor (sigma-70 family)